MSDNKKFEVTVTMWVDVVDAESDDQAETKARVALSRMLERQLGQLDSEQHPSSGSAKVQVHLHATLVDSFGPEEPVSKRTRAAINADKARALDEIGMTLTTTASWSSDTTDEIGNAITRVGLADTCAGLFRYLG